MSETPTAQSDAPEPDSRPHLVLLRGDGGGSDVGGGGGDGDDDDDGTDGWFDEAGTTTAEYTVVTAAAVAFGALLLKLLTGSWGQKILETAFREVIRMLGF